MEINDIVVPKNNDCNYSQYYSTLLNGFSQSLQKLQEKNKISGIGFNPLKYFLINENMHSFLLSQLLDPHGSHGQGNLFLQIFLEKLGIENSATKNWSVTAEKGRIDILLTRFSPHSVIIIENKSNWARDQQNQLFRYWYQHIFQKIGKDKFYDESYKRKYRIVYLVPDECKKPSELSLACPEDVCCDIRRIDCDIWTYNKHINGILKDAILKVPSSNERLRAYLSEYMEIIKSL